ncbi:MAG: PilZ domain-containing protein [Candidatus Eremiobacteraeota bacterium]|nr:PilZ domain-containing protein [Candidatus Eremiobacteraeota bacterium]MCW5869944.1 PilZ domain-containing protein [Candidatus Eremiobacteraeota bacterium]
MEENLENELSNRRGAPRLSRTLDIRYVRQGGGIQAGQAVNISQSGARLILDDAAENAELTVEFEGKIAVLARTVWRQPLSGGRQIVGVVFEGFHWGQKVALDNYLFQLESQAA